MQLVDRRGPILFVCSATRVFGTSERTCLSGINANAGVGTYSTARLSEHDNVIDVQKLHLKQGHPLYVEARCASF